MSRPLLILIAMLVVLFAGLVWLGNRVTEVPQTRIEKPVKNDAAPR